MYLTNVGL